MRKNLIMQDFKLFTLLFFAAVVSKFGYASMLPNNELFSFNQDQNKDTSLIDSVSVKDFGAKGDGITDDYNAIQTAINFISSKKGGIVFFSEGIYLIKGTNNGFTDGLNIKTSNITLVGSGKNTIVKQDSSSSYALSINNNNTGTSDIKNNIKNINISGISFICDIKKLGFSEFRHLLNINAASNVQISNCAFEGFRGDGIYLGSGNKAGIERHNENIFISNCLFDGINNDNRNGISIIDANEVLIENCTFRHISRHNMPGAIDIEPDHNRYYIVKNITIQNNKFDNIGGNSGAISYNGNPKMKEQINNLKIINNQITNSLNTGSAFTFQTKRNPTTSTSPNNIIVKNNIVQNYYQSFQVFGIKNIEFDSNVFDSTIKSGVIGFTDINSQKNIEVKLYNNTFKNNGYRSHAALILFSGNNIELKNNIFEDCGSSLDNSSKAVDFKGSGLDTILLENNISKSQRTNASINIQRESSNIFIIVKNFFSENKLIISILILMQFFLIKSWARKRRIIKFAA